MWLRYRLWLLRRAGLVIAKDCALSGMPMWGSEPYLISIGHGVAIAAEVVFITHDGATRVFRERERYSRVIKFGRINILDNCVIGYGAMIMPNVTIGPNSIVGAGSVVTRSVPPNIVVAGNPARRIMTVDQYAEWCLASTPDYDPEEYHRMKRILLERLLPKDKRFGAMFKKS